MIPTRWRSWSGRCRCSSGYSIGSRRGQPDLRQFPSLFLGLVDVDGGIEHYDGQLRLGRCRRPDGGAGDPNRTVPEYIGETVEPWSYLKSAYYAPRGYPDGLYRVGPLARLNVATSDTPKVYHEWAEFRQLEAGAVLSLFHYHYARAD